MIFLGDPTNRAAAYSVGDGGVDAQMNVDGSTVTMLASGADLAHPLDCALAYTLPAGTTNLASAYDNTNANPAVLAAEAPPAATADPDAGSARADPGADARAHRRQDAAGRRWPRRPS